MNDTVPNIEDVPKNTNPVNRFFQAVSHMVFRPGDFYRHLAECYEFSSALVFLFSFSVFYAALTSIFVTQSKLLFGFIFFLNTFFMPFITAFILYVVTILLCKNAFTYQSLFGITAYANVVLIAAWIPGLSWVAGIWKFYLIGLGMVKMGRIKNSKAFVCVLAMASLLLTMIYLLKPILKT